MPAKLVKVKNKALPMMIQDQAMLKRIMRNNEQVLVSNKNASFKNNDVLDFQISLNACKRLGVFRK